MLCRLWSRFQLRGAGLVRESPSIVPGIDRDVYLVLDDFGRMGCAWRETNVEDTDLEAVIDDLLEGQYRNCKWRSFNLGREKIRFGRQGPTLQRTILRSLRTALSAIGRRGGQGIRRVQERRADYNVPKSAEEKDVRRIAINRNG
jgi:hypothetical protein